MTNLKRATVIRDGIAMIVTDLHGNGAVFDRLCDKFLRAYEAGWVQRLIICGDLIHSNGNPEDDDSLRMLLDVMRLQEKLGKDTVILLCGNHEMPHIHGMTLSKGSMDYTLHFESELAKLDQDNSISYTRNDIINFLMDLPFYVFTVAGVMISHAGPAKKLVRTAAAKRILEFDHREFIANVDAQLAKYDLQNAREIYATKFGQPYDELARQFLAVEDENDPRYNHLLRSFVWSGDPDFELLWDALFTYNENEFPNDMRRAFDYGDMVTLFLNTMSSFVPAYPQHVIVSGHINVKGGHIVVEDNHLRIASYEHARPKQDGQFLLLDCASPAGNADDLATQLRPTFG